MLYDARRASSLSQLELYALRYPAEQSAIDSIADLLRNSAAPFSREQYTPGHLTASGLVVTPNRYIALLFHKKLQLWLQPGGHVELEDTTLEAAARREVQEELGLGDLPHWRANDPIFDIDIHQIPGFPGAAAHQHFDVRFLFLVREQFELKSPEGLATRWFPLPEVRALPDVSLARAAGKVERWFEAGELAAGVIWEPGSAEKSG